MTPSSSLRTTPLYSGARARNTLLDWFFYDVEGLTPSERAHLVAEDNVEGAILVVWPKGERGEISIEKYCDHATLCAAPGPRLARFAIAGVGSSDVGAAAFARTLADHYLEPVGAIVAGYGVADLLSEAMGGWFVMGGANRVMQMYQDALGARTTPDTGQPVADPVATVHHRTDSATLIRLLMDDDREVLSLAGHSKGCLSIAYALDKLVQSGRASALARHYGAHLTMTGTAVSLPPGFTCVRQYLGELDWFGGMNSHPGVDYATVPGAWHHLNTGLPGHLDFASLLKGRIP